MDSTGQPSYPVETVERTYGGLTFPVSKGVAILDGELAHVIARVDKPFPYGEGPNGMPVYPVGMGWALDRYYPFLDNCQYRADRLKNYAVPTIQPATLRGMPSNGDAARWFDSRPF